MSNTHSVPDVAKILKEQQDSRLRIILKDGDVFVLTNFCPIDPSIYNENGGWCCTIVEAIFGNNPKFHKLFRPGGGVDILEQDIQRIEDLKTGATLFIDKTEDA